MYAYAVMSNHYHVVLYMDVERAQSWDDEEVARRWLRLCPPKSPLDATEEESSTHFRTRLNSLLVNPEQLAVYRERLHSLSWLMRFLNESIARKANHEDGVKGRFWEGRFKSQALLDEGAILACMAYVDLNPIRAGVTDRLEDAHYTSAKDRIESVEQGADADTALTPLTETQLPPPSAASPPAPTSSSSTGPAERSAATSAAPSRLT